MAAYDYVADEYYDPQLHPTCSNFRLASQRFLEEPFCRSAFRGRILEIGAGKSLIAAMMRRHVFSSCHLVVTDVSQRMLSYSEEYSGDGIVLERANATNLPFQDAAFDVVVSILGDPYNLPEVWTEVRRVLHPRGTVVFTTPAFAWARSFRPSTEIHEAEFVLRNRSTVRVPSYVYSSEEQMRLFTSCGFRLGNATELTKKDLGNSHISPKLLVSDQASVVTGYLLHATEATG